MNEDFRVTFWRLFDAIWRRLDVLSAAVARLLRLDSCVAISWLRWALSWGEMRPTYAEILRRARDPLS